VEWGMSGEEGGAQQRGGEVEEPQDPPVAGEFSSTETEFLETLVWAFDALQGHTRKRGHRALAQLLTSACRAARDELEAARPSPAQVAAARMRALWQQEALK